MQNIGSRIPRKLKNEFFEEILQGDSFRLERIVSPKLSTPEGEWYDQKQDEWVILLQGSAGIRIKGKKRTIALKPGDHLNLPAHQKHRVEWTQKGAQTIWLALHYQRKKRKK